MNLLLAESARMPFHTDLRAVFNAFGGRQREFTWLLTNLQIAGDQHGLPGLAADAAPLLLTGGELTARVEAYAMQFVWGVLSGFEPTAVPDLTQLDPHPWADGNSAIWRPHATPQHPLARVELICFDSELTLLYSRDEDLLNRFQAYFPEAIDLDGWVRSQKSDQQ